jgi:cysteine desulfurase
VLKAVENEPFCKNNPKNPVKSPKTPIFIVLKPLVKQAPGTNFEGYDPWKGSQKMVFLDHAATTRPDPRVLEEIARFSTLPLNASSVHQFGQKARFLLEEAREELAQLLGASPEQVLFTSGATEGNNLVLRGLAARALRQNKILNVKYSSLEHPCIRKTAEILGLQGHECTLLPISSTGKIQVSRENIQKVDLLCLMAVQNETGVIQPLGEARQHCQQTDTLWLCDGTQGLALLDLNIPRLGADFLTMSSHKIYGPAGVGAVAGPGLAHIDPLLTGGPQEHELRAGTQPVALIRGFVKAAVLAVAERNQRRQHFLSNETTFFDTLKQQGVTYQLNGAPKDRLPGFLNLSIPGFKGSDLVIALDSRGFCVSSGSACSTGVIETSVALTAMFPEDPQRAAGALRITPGKDTTKDQMIDLGKALGEIIGCTKND